MKKTSFCSTVAFS